MGGASGQSPPMTRDATLTRWRPEDPASSKVLPRARTVVIRRVVPTDSIGIMEPRQENPYLRETVLTATPEQLHLMLYDGAIRFASQGRDAILAKDIEGSYNKLTRAQKIIIEMQNGLNPEVNPELCGRMAALYNFIYQKLIDACVRREVQAVDDALTVLRYNRETWQLLVGKVSGLRADTERDAVAISDQPPTSPARSQPPPGVASLVAAKAPRGSSAHSPSSWVDTISVDESGDRPAPLSIDA